MIWAMLGPNGLVKIAGNIGTMFLSVITLHLNRTINAYFTANSDRFAIIYAS